MNRGGAETLIMNVYRKIDRAKIQFDFLTSKKGSFDEEIKSLGGKVFRIPYVSDVGHRHYIRSLSHFFLTHKEYQVVHSHLDKMSGFVLKTAKKAGIPFRISHSHNTSSEGSILAKAYKWYAGRHIFSNASEFFACSEAAAHWLYKRQANKAKIIKNGVDPHHFHYSEDVRQRVRERLNILNGTFVIGHVGRFNRQKNHEKIIEIFFEVTKREPQSHLLLIGEGPLKKKMEQMVRTLGLQDHVDFLGVRSDVHELLQSFDLLLFPSLHEGLPVTLIEAQASRLPCLISEVISDEVDIGAQLISYERLESNAHLWAMKALELNQVRKEGQGAWFSPDYDIHTTVKKLQNFYLGLHSKRREVVP
nr:glycosyltransferase family 1 protein [Pullulanibacillus pueri]